MTKIPVVHIEEGAELKLVCQHCDYAGDPKREFLSQSENFTFETARCRKCQKEIAGIVVREKEG
jgi:hypothetical protein